MSGGPLLFILQSQLLHPFNPYRQLRNIPPPFNTKSHNTKVY